MTNPYAALQRLRASVGLSNPAAAENHLDELLDLDLITRAQRDTGRRFLTLRAFSFAPTAPRSSQPRSSQNLSAEDHDRLIALYWHAQSVLSPEELRLLARVLNHASQNQRLSLGEIGRLRVILDLLLPILEA